MKTRKLFESIIACIVLIAFVGCNVALDPETKSSYTSSTVKSVVAKAIDEQMTYVKDLLDPELQSEIDNLNTKAIGQSKGKQIVDKTMDEYKGPEYVDFCYNVEGTSFLSSTDAILDSAYEILPSQDYNFILTKADETSKSLQSWGEEKSKSLPLDQQKPFYDDLKVLVTRSIVLMTAGIVYAKMPTTMFWGKVSAAAAISIAAGLFALAAMDIYEQYKFDDESLGPGDMSITDWLKELVKQPQADYALTSTVVALATAYGQGAVVTGIMICVFGALQAMDLISAMLRKYDFDL